MKNRAFHFTLRSMRTAKGERLTVGRMAEAVYVNRSRLNDVLNNKPGHGGNTRWKVVKFLKESFPKEAVKLIEALGWDEDGNIQHSTFNNQHPMGSTSPRPAPHLAADAKRGEGVVVPAAVSLSHTQQSVPCGTSVTLGSL